MASVLLTAFLLAPVAKVAELSMPKLLVSIFSVSVEGLKLVILSADFLLNFDGLLIDALARWPLHAAVYAAVGPLLLAAARCPMPVAHYTLHSTRCT